MMDGEKPLVTISMMTYNQEKYVRDAVRGLLSQTYDPLEIVISDDCSTDRTWEIINEEIGKYKKNGGLHSIILNRNDENLGIAMHSAKIDQFKHGVIAVGCGGDDISMPKRVERIVEVMSKHKDVSLLIHSAVIINEDGLTMGALDERTVEHPLGAVFARNLQLLKSAGFGAIVEKNAFDDQINARRAQMIGKVISIPDKLLYYRVGSGVSSITHKRRAVEMHGAKARMASCRQTRLDIKTMRGKVSGEILDKISRSNEKWYDFAQARVDLYSGDSIKIRWRGFKGCCKGCKVGIGMLLFAAYLFPKWISDPLMDSYTGVKNWLKARRHFK